MSYVLAAADPECVDWISRLSDDLAPSEIVVQSEATEFEFASVEWKYSLEADIDGASCFVFFSSHNPENAVHLAQAAQLAAQHETPFIPVTACEDHYAGSLHYIMNTVLENKRSKRPPIKYIPRLLWNGLIGVTGFASGLILLIALAIATLAGVFGGNLQEIMGAVLIDITDYTVPGVTRYVKSQILFTDDFETGEANNWENDGSWEVVQDPATGNLVLQGSSEDWTQTLTGDTSWRNYSLETRVYIAHYGNPPYGSGFGLLLYQDALEECETAFYLWRPSLDYAILAQADDGLAETCGQFIELDLVPFRLPIEEWMAVRVDVFGNTIQCYIDGELIASAIVPEYIYDGRIGFQVPPGNVVWFDDVQVTKLKTVR